MLNEKKKEELLSIISGLKDNLKEIMEMAEKDLEIDDTDLDDAVIKTPKLLAKYNNLLTNNTISLKDLYSFQEKVKLERWKYWQGKQSDKYYSENGIVHEKILKGDVEKYLSADEKIILVKEMISVQKAIVDYLERCIKEIQTRNFHCRVAVDWRKFTNGGY